MSATNIQLFSGAVSIPDDLRVVSLTVEDGLVELGANGAFANVGYVMNNPGGSNAAVYYDKTVDQLRVVHTDFGGPEDPNTITISNEDITLNVAGNTHSRFYYGDGGLLSNLVSDLQSVTAVEANSDQMIILSNATALWANVGNVLVAGNVTSVTGGFHGDGGWLTNVQTTFEETIVNGNTTSNIVEFHNALSLVTTGNVGIQNVAPLGDLSIGANVIFDDDGTDILTVRGNINCAVLTIGQFALGGGGTQGLQQITNIGNTTTITSEFNNVSTAFVTTSKAGIGIATPSSDAMLHVDGHVRLGGAADTPDNENMFVRAAGALNIIANHSNTDNTTSNLVMKAGEINAASITLAGAVTDDDRQKIVFKTRDVEALAIDAFGNATFSSNVIIATGGQFFGDAGGLSNVNGSDVTNLDATNITAGTLNKARLPETINNTTIEDAGNAILTIHDSSGDNKAAVNYETDSYTWQAGLHGGSGGHWRISKDAFGANSGANDFFQIDTNGQVGIGMPATYKLSVGGAISMNDYMYHNGDTDTKIGFPADDTFTVTTANSERLRVDSSGRLGVGTNNPETDIHTHATSSAIMIEGTNNTIGTDTAQLILKNKLTRQCGIKFMNIDDDTQVWHIGRRYAAGGNNTRLSFSNANGDQVMTITNAGSVGVGTSLPSSSHKLDVHGSANVGVLTATSGTFSEDVTFESNIHVKGQTLVANTVNLTVADAIIELGSNNLNTGDLGLVMTRHASSNVAVFFDEGADILRLGYTLNGANDTDIALDTNNALPVDVQGTLTAASVSADSLVTNDYLIHDGDTDTKIGFPANDTFTVTTANSERLRVASSGKVGIGTTTPSYALDTRGIVDAYRYVTSNVFPLPDENQHAFRYVAMGTYASVPYCLTQAGGSLYEYDPSTGQSVCIVHPVSAPTRGTVSVTAGKEYFSVGSPLAMVYIYTVAPFSALGSLFGFLETRNDPSKAWIYAPYSNVSVSYYHNTSVTGTATDTIVVPQGVVTQFTCTSDNDATGTDSHVFVVEGGKVLMTSAASGYDFRLLKPLSTVVYGYKTIVYDTIYRDSDVSTPGGKCIVSNTNVPVIVSDSGDGDGTDATAGTPLELVTDTYAVPHTLRGWIIKYLHPETKVRATYWDATNEQWETYGTYEPSGTPTITSPEEYQEGKVALSNVNPIVSDMVTTDLWLFTGTHDFVLTVEEQTDKEVMPLGWRSGRVHQMIQHNLLSNVFQDSSNNVGIGVASPTSKLDVGGNVKHQGLTMTSGTDVDQLTTITQSLQVTATWMDTGIVNTNLESGTYIVQIYSHDQSAGGGNYNEYYSGIMSWYSGDTNSTEATEIILTAAGYDPNDNHIYLRVQRTVSSDTDNLKLQIRKDYALTSAYTYTFKFRRMI